MPHNVESPIPANKDAVLLFSESNTRFLCEVSPDHVEQLMDLLGDDVIAAEIGEVTDEQVLQISGQSAHDQLSPIVIDATITKLKETWLSPLKWS